MIEIRVFDRTSTNDLTEITLQNYYKIFYYGRKIVEIIIFLLHARDFKTMSESQIVLKLYVTKQNSKRF